MATTIIRYYNCKDEELLFICLMAASSLKRDLAEFSAYSPKFSDASLSAFEADVKKAMTAIPPQTEIALRKICTARLYALLDSLIDPVNRLKGYLKFANLELGKSASDFRLTHLRKSIAARNTEGAIKNLHIVIENVENFKDSLIPQGLTEVFISMLLSKAKSIKLEKQTQYELLVSRRNLTQSNLVLFNSLYRQLTEILFTGKILYRTTDPAKFHEYAFSHLKKRV